MSIDANIKATMTVLENRGYLPTAGHIIRLPNNQDRVFASMHNERNKQYSYVQFTCDEYFAFLVSSGFLDVDHTRMMAGDKTRVFWLCIKA